MGVVFDIETSGLDEYSDEIVSYGIVKNNKVKIVCRLKASEEELLQKLREDLEDVLEGKIIFWQFNGYNSS